MGKMIVCSKSIIGMSDNDGVHAQGMQLFHCLNLKVWHLLDKEHLSAKEWRGIAL